MYSAVDDDHQNLYIYICIYKAFQDDDQAPYEIVRRLKMMIMKRSLNPSTPKPLKPETLKPPNPEIPKPLNP